MWRSKKRSRCAEPVAVGAERSNAAASSTAAQHATDLPPAAILPFPFRPPHRHAGLPPTATGAAPVYTPPISLRVAAGEGGAGECGGSGRSGAVGSGT
nr:unnamed protein product [Digitaria exilis]